MSRQEIRLIARGKQADQIGVRFYVTPELNESRSVNYEEISDIRQAGGILIYIGTPLRTYQINARMVSRTQEEADYTYRCTHLLKSWCTPSSTGGLEGYGGNAPDIVRLWGYGSRQLRGVPTVVTSLGIDFPNSVSYIQASNGSYVPIIQNFSIALKEARTGDELAAFNIDEYRQGILPYW